ncbi:glycosyltransferase family 4 protein [Nocardioides ginkgobilobae]
MSKPRVLVIGLNYTPERTGIAPYTAGMAVGLSEDFDVEVLTVHPHYPEWSVAEGYGGWRRREVIDGVRVHRVKHYVPHDPTGVTRILSETTYAGRALAPGVRRPDVIVAVSPALAPVASALALGRRWRVPVGVVVQDLYSKALSELELLGGRIDRPAHRFEQALLRRCDGVVSIHQAMADVMVRDYDVPRERIEVIPNWTHVSPPSGDREVRRKELGWDDDVLTIVHAGNMGAKQGLEHLIPVGRMIDYRSLPVRIVLIGNGGNRDALESAASDIESLQFMDALPGESFMETLAAADALLLHEKPGLKEMCVPSKLTSYFAASRPVLAVTSPESAAAHEVRQSRAGFVVRSGDAEALLQGLHQMAEAARDDCGARGLEYAKRTLDERAALLSYNRWVNGLLETRR